MWFSFLFSLFLTYYSSERYFFPVGLWVDLSSCSVQRSSVRTLCGAGLEVMRSFHLFLSWAVFIFLSVITDGFAEYNSQGWQLSQNLKYICQVLLAFKVLVE